MYDVIYVCTHIYSMYCHFFLESTEVINSKDDKILQLESELTHWKLECDSLRDSLRSATSVQVDLQKQKDSLQETLESSEIKTKQQQVKQLEKEVEMLRGRLESMAHQTDQRESGEFS